jgi:hypothetical protein
LHFAIHIIRKKTYCTLTLCTMVRSLDRWR